jgi:predicted transcriptional regulator
LGISTRIELGNRAGKDAAMGTAMEEKSIGEQELALLQHLADCECATAGEISESYGKDRNLARTTVLTMMERLRKKGYVSRRLVGGVYRYSAVKSSAEILRGLVGRFIEKNLGGSIAPFLEYLNEAAPLTNKELRTLEKLVAKLEVTRNKGK